MITGIHHTGLIVNDLNKLLPFYCDVLGMEVAVDLGLQDGPEVSLVMGVPGSKIKIVMLQMAGQIFELIQLLNPAGKPMPDDAKFAQVGHSHVAFRVKDIDEVYASLKQKGVQFVCPPQVIPELKFFYLRDPEGNWIEMIQPLI
ncbi:MAG: VOC family protein [Dehalococcoidia bacterium]|nr:VOC family protein [Dehalococcoidia bacterium]